MAGRGSTPGAERSQSQPRNGASDGGGVHLGSRKTHKQFVHISFVGMQKRKMATNRVAIELIRAILCAEKAMLLGYILGRVRAPGRPTKS